MVSSKEVQKILSIFLAVALVLFPKIVFSLGFGQIKLFSHLNEPLDAEIEVLDPEDIDTTHLVASLASTEDFTRAELPRPFYLTKLRFEIKPQDKRTIIHVTTQDAIKQPFLEFLTVMSWPEGRLVRGYTLLLDPAPEEKTNLKESVNLSENTHIPEQDIEAINTIHGKMARNSISGQSKPLVKNQKGINSFDDSTNNPDFMPEKISQLENLFEADSATVRESTSKAAIRMSQPVSKVSNERTRSSATRSTESNPNEFNNAVESSEINSPNGIEINGTYEKKLLLGSGLVLFFAVGMTFWLFRNARATINLEAGTTNLGKGLSNLDSGLPSKMVDQELDIKLVLAEQYYLVQDFQSSREILDEVLLRGNINEKEKARVLLNKINNP